MSILELTLCIIAAVLPFFLSSTKKLLSTRFLLITTISLFILHLFIDGTRWQMIPIYLIYIILVIALALGKNLIHGNWLIKSLISIALLLLLGLGAFISSVLPVFELPKPTGTYSVGSQYFQIDTDQDEIITPIKGDKRSIMLKAWYPSIIKDEAREPYLNQGDRQGFAAKYGLPKWTINYLDKIRTHTYSNSSIVNETFPVLIFSHGYYSQASGYYALIEEIVSHGYVVLNINHTYESVGSQFSNGDIRMYDTEYDREHNNQEMADMAWQAMQAYKNAATDDEQLQVVENSIRNYVAADITNRWEEDITSTLIYFREKNSSTFLSEHIDTSKIGVFGHSQGGAAAGQALNDVAQIKAGINIDGTQWGNMIDTAMTKPFLYISSDWPDTHPDFNKYAYSNGSYSDLYKAKITNTGHSNFMDIPFMVSLSMLNEAGTIDKKRAIEITAEMVVSFFDKYLKDQNIELVQLTDKFPELEIDLHDLSNQPKK